MAAVFVAATAVTWVLLRRPMGPLDRAVAVIAAPEPDPEPVTAEGVPVPLPTNLRFGRKGLVSLALDARRGDYPREDLEPVLAEVLKLSDGAARCAVTALGLAPARHPAPDPAVELARNAVSWTAARQALERQMGLTRDQAESVRGEICRRAVQPAFQSEQSLADARLALGKYGEMIGAQVEGVLVMAAAIELADAGPESCEPLQALREDRPTVAARLAGAAGCQQ
jgi:hypothetical protein